MPDRLTELQLTPEAVTVLKELGIGDLAALSQANVTELQNGFIEAAKAGRYPEKFPSLVKIAAWVEQARNIEADQPEGGPSKDLDNIPTAVVKPSEAKKKRVHRGSGARSAGMDLRPDRHRRVKRDPEAPEPVANGGQVTLTPRQDEVGPSVSEELNPADARRLHNRRQSPSLRTSTNQAPTKKAAPAQPAPVQESRPLPEPEPEPVVPQEPESPAPKGPAFRTFDDYKEGRVAVKPLDRHSLALGEDDTRSTGSEQESFEEEIAYKKRMPIWRIRGVKHPDGLKVYVGAFITFIAVLLTIVTCVTGGLLLFYDLQEYKLKFAILFAVTLAFGAMYIITAIGMRCRVCSCHLFYSRRCLKNVKAHRILGFFPMVAQTIHILFWRWFRCMYCGTAVRLTEESANHDYDE